ncbi:hypothetical protein QFC24_004337 [Naganishia onofrii]|uniref:Uncharacterized protein n=1 Tax=Naganishia onofrii TaxID=1851511 RepID=A0ACC2XDI9_9TREE|nr:hypothetical protein QFC24_004337 [Naganishia onofrii]
MSLPPASYDPRRIFMFNLPKFNVGSKGREIGTYVAGGLYMIPEYNEYAYYGGANVGMNGGLMLSAIVLWIAQSASDEYRYELTL